VLADADVVLPFPAAALPAVQVGVLPAGYETSGLAWHEGLGRLLVVDDGGRVSLMNLAGGEQVHWNIGGDLEAICVADPLGSFAYVAVEHPDAILEIDLRDGTVTRQFDLTPWLTGADNLGLEALAFVPTAASAEGGIFLAGLQADGRVFAFELPIASSTESEVVGYLGSWNPPTGLTDIADLSYDPVSGMLLGVFDGANRLVATDTSGTVVTQWTLPGIEQEGILLHGGSLYVGQDYGGAAAGVILRYDGFAAANPSAAEYLVKHPPRLQPGDTPLPGYAGSDLDRVDVLWQTVPAGAGSDDSFTVDVRITGGGWRAVTPAAPVETGVDGRLVWSASLTGLAWNSDHEYRVRHLRAGVVVAEYAAPFRTRLRAGDAAPFSFAAYGDSAAGGSAGFRAVQGRINQSGAAFAVLLGDNAYSSGSHAEYDARFEPSINPEAAAWTASHLDYVSFGNHDIATAAGLPTEQLYAAPVPVAGVTAPAAPPAGERPEHNYSWDYGSVHFVAFDSNSLDDPGRLDGLLDWVTADLAASSATWKIAVAHHPVAGVPDKPQAAGDDYYQQVVNRLKAAGVDLLMTGHSHTYGWSYPLTGQVGGVATFADQAATDRFVAGQGIVQLVSGAGGVEIRSGGFGDFPFVAAGFSGSTATAARPGFSQIDVSADRLVVSYVAADDGSVIDAFTIEKQATTTVSFQQGVAGFTGTVDTSLRQAAPAASFAAAATLEVDADDPAGTLESTQGLLQFRGLFGSLPGRIPWTATIVSATLEIEVTNGGQAFELHRMLGTWDPAATWQSQGGGIQADGVEATAFADASSGIARTGRLSFDVVASLRHWQSRPGTNFGWALLPTGNDGIDFLSAESATPPRLVVTYAAAPAPAATPARFHVVDGTTARVARVAAGGVNLGLAALPAAVAAPRGIAASADGARLWVIGAGGAISVHDAGMRRLGGWTASGLVDPTGIAVVGRDVWVSDAGLGRVVLFAGAAARLSGTQVATRSFALAAANAHAQDLATNGRLVWVVDAGPVDRVFVYRAETGVMTGTWTLAAANASPTGITIDPTDRSQNVWVVDASTRRVFVYAQGRGLRAGRGVAAATFALAAAVHDPQGIVDPPVRRRHLHR